MDRSFTGCRWELAEVRTERVRALQEATGLSEPAARVMAIRFEGSDVPDPEQILTPSIEHLHDPYAMMQMDEAVDRLRSAKRRNESIRVVTDYDVDGTTSSLILQAALGLLPGDCRVDYHIPNRFDEGYGFSVRAARKAADEGVKLIVTADIGVRDHAAVAAAKEAGVDVLICDHHLPAGESVPADATVLCPPRKGDTYPNRSLAACGVSLKLAQALLADRPNIDRIVRSLLKLAAIGTVADMVSLGTLENRAIVALGLVELNRGPHHAGLRSLLQVAGLTAGGIDESSLGYRIGPRINAAGRVADATLVVELLTTRDEAAAQVLAQRLDALNTERRDIQKRLVDDALATLAAAGETDPFVLLSGAEEAGWHRGVVGIVAARIKDVVHRPVAVVSIQGELAVGSVRSIAGLHAVQALESAADLLLKFGGHPAAAGFTVRTADLDKLRLRLGAFVVRALAGEGASALPPDALVPVRRADIVIEAEAIGDRLRKELDQLGPFGSGNPSATLWVPNVRPTGVQVRGETGALLKFRVPCGASTVDAVWWNHAEHAEQLRGDPVDLLVHLEENVWRGERRLQLAIRDAGPATGAAS